MSVIHELKVAESLISISEIKFIDAAREELSEYKLRLENLIECLNNNAIVEQPSGHQPLSTRVIQLLNYFDEHKFLEVSYQEIINNTFEDFENSLNSYLEELPEIKSELQNKERFLSNSSDGLLLKFQKSVKRLSYKTTAVNEGIKSKLKKKKFSKDEFYWNRKVYLRNFITYYIAVPFLKEFKKIWINSEESLLPERVQIYQTVSDIYESYLKYEESSDNYNAFVQKINDAINFYTELIKRINERSAAILISTVDKVKLITEAAEELYPKAGTVELPNRKFSLNKIERQEKRNDKYFLKNLQQIRNFAKAINSKWISFYSLTLTNINIIQDFNTNKNILLKGIKENIEVLFDQFNNELKKLIEELKNSDVDYPKIIVQKQSEFYEKLNIKFIDELIQRITLENPYLFVSKIQESFLNEISKLPSQMLIVKDDVIDLKIRDKDFRFINPREIVEAELGADYRNKLIALKKEIDVEIKKFGAKLIEIGQIIDYNLETAISILESNEENSIEQSRKTAVEGIERALSRSKILFENFNSLRDDSINRVDKLTRSFAKRLDEFQNFENLLQMKLKVSKAKAEEKVKLIIKEAVTNTRHIVPILLRKSRYIYTTSKSKIKNISFRVGINEEKQTLSVELTDYLLQTDEQIRKLPSVYQRLFSKNAIKDDRFVVGRMIEQNQIIHDYENWMSGKKVSIVIVGEKGNGNSTLVGSAVNKFNNPPRIINREVKNTIGTPQQLFDLITENLGIEKCNSQVEIIHSIQSLPEKQIFILENIEGMFLRVVNGFEPLKIFAQIVTSTNTKILWVCTCNIYSWNYLDRVAKIRDYFQTIISLGNISKNEIKHVILKRHAISGYDLEFLLPENPPKKLLAQPQAVQQELLKEEFFENLHRFANGNLRLSHLFWLRSINVLEGEKIEINSLSEMSFSFVKQLSDSKLFNLMAMILHDGLTIEECSQIFNINQKDAELLVSSMVDDGIAVETVDGFKVNFLLYSVIIKLLQDKNIIH